MTTATKVSIKPLEDRVVVQANEAETTTASGLVIPDTAKEKPQEGTVVAVGPGRIDDNGNRVPLDVNVGDVVIYSKYGGTEVKYGGEEYLVLSARDLLAVVVSASLASTTMRSSSGLRVTLAAVVTSFPPSGTAPGRSPRAASAARGLVRMAECAVLRTSAGRRRGCRPALGLAL